MAIKMLKLVVKYLNWVFFKLAQIMIPKVGSGYILGDSSLLKL